ncbi:unnamed protein product [Timema podura]|uniref:Uncharacterized protein n=1 Tax=Timema podura TaxID=61482 RepID=A0ABN7NVD5_TIMPD|nr:unnamed protein product [Timema podura]
MWPGYAASSRFRRQARDRSLFKKPTQGNGAPVSPSSAGSVNTKIELKAAWPVNPNKKTEMRKDEYRGTVPTFAWNKRGKPPSERPTNLPVIDSLVYCKSSPLDRAATEAHLIVFLVLKPLGEINLKTCHRLLVFVNERQETVNLNE